MPRTLKRVPVAMWASTSSLPTLTRPLYSSAIASMVGAIARHGAHHAAQKSTKTGVLDFTKITVPHSQGYRISLELIGGYFRVYAVPARYNITGRLSFLTDNTLSVRASDRAGQQASCEDGEYKGESV